MRRNTLPIVGLVLFFAPLAGAQQVNLLSMGDWGSNAPKQRAVAATMADYVKQSGRKFDAMLLAGDNFYVPLEGGIHDPKWKTMFEDLYDPKILDFPFYVSLGNHDYQLDRFMVEFAYGQANPQSRWKMPARWYRVDLPLEDPLVTILMLDSNQPLLGENAWKDQLKWLKTELEKPRESEWLITVCHHPLVSNGDHGDIGPLAAAWGPMLTKASADFFIAGHDHDLQHLEVRQSFPMSFLLCGGGGATTRPMRVDPNRRGPFSIAAHGFADLSFTAEQATVKLVGDKGVVLHSFTRDRSGQIKIVEAGKPDPATPRTVKSITRGGSEVPEAKKEPKATDD